MVSSPIHDEEPDTSETTVRNLLHAECRQWADRPIEYLHTSGTDNAMWRIRTERGPDLVARLPRRPGAAAGVAQEVAVLERIEGALGSSIQTPRVRHAGAPHESFPHDWSVLEWIDGVDCWSHREQLAGQSPAAALATDLGGAVTAIAALTDVDVQPRTAGSRGGPLRPLLERLDEWLSDPHWAAVDLIDIAAVKRLAAAGLEVADEPSRLGFVHGDLIPGNLLIDGGRLSAVIDWGGAGRGDVAQDYAPAWAVLTADERRAFRDVVGADDAAWIRGRTFELEHAVGGVLYYVPRRHPLGDVMARTLDRLLTAE